MKKVILVCLVVFGMMFCSCSNSSSTLKNEIAIEVEETPIYPPELIEKAKQFHLKIDTTKTYDMDIMIIQSLGDYDGFAVENSDKGQRQIVSQLLYYISSNMVYDGKNIKEKAFMMGTYHYKRKDSTYSVVPFYCGVDYYNENSDQFDFVLELQDPFYTTATHRRYQKR